jgi:putative transposase
VYGYCLMANHVHLIVEPRVSATSLSVLMKSLAGQHAQRLNKVYGRTGSAWEGRFRCSLITSDRYLLACSRYVDLNPVRAGIAVKPEDYAWSSYRAKVGLETCAWLDPDPCYLALASTVDRQQRCYREFVEQRADQEELAMLREAVQRNRVIGGLTPLLVHRVPAIWPYKLCRARVTIGQ